MIFYWIKIYILGSFKEKGDSYCGIYDGDTILFIQIKTV